MQPFFFGSSERQLFGKMYVPDPSNDRGTGIVICQSFWVEYIKAHRAVGYIAQCLADAGFHTLLFDYYSTGDSAGDCGTATAAELSDNVVAAVEELCESTGIESYGLVGIRFGAALMAHACRNGNLEPFAAAFWDPVATGVEFMQQINATHAAAGTLFDPESVKTVAGFPTTKKQMVTFCSINETAWFSAASHRQLMLFSSEERKSTWEQMCGEIKQLQALLITSSDGDWCNKLSYEKALIPKEVHQKMTEFFTGCVF